MNFDFAVQRFFGLRHAFAPVAAAAILAGCAHSPQNPAHHLGTLQMPEKWSQLQNQDNANAENSASADMQAVNIQSWWHHFDDAQLNNLIARAFENNASFLAAEQTLIQARAQSEASGATLLPSIGASAGANRSQTGRADPRNRYSAGLDASWEIDLWGRKGSAADASAASALAAQATFDDARRTLAADVATAYVQLRSIGQRLHIAKTSLAMLEQTAQIVRWRADSGLASSLEVEQSRQSLAQQRAQIPALQASHAQAMHALATLLGEPSAELAAYLAPQPPAEVSPSPQLAQTPSTPKPDLGRGSSEAANEAANEPSNAPASTTSPFLQTLAHMRAALDALPPIPQSSPALAAALASTPIHTIERRPDVRARIHRVEAAMAQLAAQEVANWPTLRLSANWSSGAATLAALSNAASIGTSVAASLAASLFDGGANAAQIRAQSAALEAARQNLRGSVLLALQEVEDALALRQADAQRLAHLRTAHQAAHNAAMLAMLRYEGGLVDFQTVLDTQRSVLSAQDTLAQATASLTNGDIRLYKALGGGWGENPENAEVSK